MKKTGRKKIGKYIVDLGDELGSGSCAKVYRGANTQNNDQVAVKIIDKTQIQSDEYMKNAFYEEIRIMTKLKSPNIIGFLDVNQTKSNFYLVLEIANQGSFRTILNSKKHKKEQLTQNQIIKYLVQLVNGFGAMFKLGVIHRDIKPENIFVKDDKLKIGDFGFAKNNQKLDSMMQTIVGSPAYMAPQILKKEKYSYKCDIWSLGVMTFEMLVGNLPFDYKKVQFSQDKDFDKDRKKIYQTVIDTKINYPPHIKISANMENFIRGCLQINEKDRFDWLQLFRHPIFKGIFQQNFSNMKKGEQLLSYIMGQFRMIFNQYNVDIIAELDKLNKPVMSVDNFKQFLQYLNCDIYAEESEALVELLKKNDSISLKDFQNLMEIHECLPTVKPLSNESILIADKKKLSLVVNLIKKVNKSKEINFNELIPKEIMTKQELNFQDFSKIIHSLVPQVPEHVLPQFKKIMFQSEQGKSVPIPWFIEVIKDMLKEEEEQKNT